MFAMGLLENIFSELKCLDFIAANVTCYGFVQHLSTF